MLNPNFRISRELSIATADAFASDCERIDQITSDAANKRAWLATWNSQMSTAGQIKMLREIDALVGLTDKEEARLLDLIATTQQV